MDRTRRLLMSRQAEQKEAQARDKARLQEEKQAEAEKVKPDDGVFEPNLYLYDSYAGGVGQSAPLFRLAPKLFQHAGAMVDRCSCEFGCPSCTGPIGEIGERGKEAAKRFLTALCT